MPINYHYALKDAARDESRKTMGASILKRSEHDS
ncbi:hypothetical protein NK6_2505 [Bradyrhizobium diazoefficiens]|uniref:Uncharacterized protein n=1 Tax=Bradyrhizobium diazoefficiens TaxID=1355477 RepID=A0A0E4BMS4_9BRAD|nr:hypothetical protein NK6_2505 [Bradyrhizobium diazoefficiens]